MTRVFAQGRISKGHDALGCGWRNAGMDGHSQLDNVHIDVVNLGNNGANYGVAKN